MKRITAILLCMTLLCALAITASAASAHMSLSSSAGTVYRGDTFTLTVSLSNNQPVSNGGIVLSYDSSAFELVGGSCSVSDATLAEVSAANGGGVFLLQTDAVVSGTIFTINMKVKSNAAFGSYTISGTPSLSIDCSISGTTVTVGCKHSFGAASKVDGANHQRTCSICNQTVKEAHTWDKESITKDPTCKDTGTKKLTCSACGAEKTENIPVTSDHKYGSWDTLGGDGHTRKCTVCGKNETADHNWYIYEITEEATCQTSGWATIVCEDCGEAAEQEFETADHSYGAPTDVTATQHTHQCSACGSAYTEDHVFGDELEHDADMHYFACEICGYKKDQAEHEPGPKATEETDQVCLVCNRVLKPKGAHVHEYVEEWSSDELNHWHDCVDCPARDAEMAHVFDSDCDNTCNVCGLTRQVTHFPIPTLECDETGHWYPCLICGEKQNFSAHTPGPAATVTSSQTCTACEFEIAPIVPHDHIYDTGIGAHVHKCACGNEYAANAKNCPVCAEANPQFPWWIVCILEALIFGGVIVYLILKKNHNASGNTYAIKAAFADDDAAFEEEESDASISDDLDDLDDLDELLSKILSEDGPDTSKTTEE